MTEADACLCFSLIDGIGPKTFVGILNHFGSTQDAWEKLSEKDIKKKVISKLLYERFELFKKNFDVQGYLDKLKKTKVQVTGYTDNKYPSLLKELHNPPIVLYCKGNLGLLDSQRNIGVVGARKITSYGIDVTEKLVSELVSYGFTIVSGLAFGVDAIAHKTAIENRGLTIAVLGCGVDCCTPEENQGLYEKILDSGGLITSEYPLGMPPSLGSFPARNRIIAGLSLGILVTEAAEDSGSLITANEALRLGRPVYAVPGSINSMMSKGTLKLLKQGATLVSSGKDIIGEFQVQGSQFMVHGKDEKIKNLKLNPQEKRVVEMVENEEMSLDILAKSLKIPITKLMVIVSSLEMRGILVNKSGEISLKTTYS